MTRLLLMPLLLAAALLGGCDLAEEDFQPEVVVEGVLVAQEPLPPVRLSRTAALDEVYAFDRLALSGAEAVVLLLDGAGGVEARFPYEERAPGTYRPRDVHAVLPSRTYRLEVQVPEAADVTAAGGRVRAETTVPDTFRVVRPPPDTVRYDIFATPPTIDVTRTETTGRAAVFIFSIVALAPDEYGLTPTLAELLDEDDDPSDFIEGSSPILNEGNYSVNPDGTLALQVPWFGISYYGPNRFVANALDDALYDFYRSRDAQFGATTLSPGEIQRVLSNIEHGTGVFGSVAQASVEVFIAP